MKYRSALFFSSAQQAQLALVAKQRLDASGKLGKPVATVIVPLANSSRPMKTSSDTLKSTVALPALFEQVAAFPS